MSKETDTAQEKKQKKNKSTNEMLTEQAQILEALVFASDEAVSLNKLKEILPGRPDARQIRKLISEINHKLQKQRHPFEIVDVAGGYQVKTVPYFAPWIRQLFKEKPAKKLSAQALECLAVIAYKQPITKAEVEEIRGVLSDGAMKTILEKHLVTIAGRSDKPGRPLFYATTNTFLDYFGIKSINDLPKIEEFEEMAKKKMEDIEEEIQAIPDNEVPSGQTPENESNDETAEAPKGEESQGEENGDRLENESSDTDGDHSTDAESVQSSRGDESSEDKSEEKNDAGSERQQSPSENDSAETKTNDSEVMETESEEGAENPEQSSQEDTSQVQNPEGDESSDVQAENRKDTESGFSNSGG
ncbi:MAG: SMC-Scp complex subunit ScpB [Chitinivibrionales bacterium]|nr:SMC-Scp complex subunit ScpB [Chitinivibrionales bacterium]